MKKIANFIVEKRYLILVTFLILSGISIYLSNKVVVNHDMSKYLPSSSETRQGMNIMEDEFETLDTSTLNIMIQDLSDEEKQEAYNYLEDIDHVTDVDYDETSKYNKDEYTLYVLTIDDKAEGKDTAKVYDTITSYFGDKLVDTSGTASDYNKDILPFYIIVLAVFSALIILIIMSESYWEPFLFLITILIAVALNNGTNIIFDNVSNITSSISAILQMALSIDYSIMLMNRYRQERENETDKVKAMKRALHNSFKAISSSSVTTIVGLLALVFMSFTIGRDFGFVLAKGVLFSLISIFTCLPGLIIMSDKLLYKTKKKSPIITLNFVGSIAHKMRYVALILFIAIFIGSYFLKGNLGILYTASGTDEIDKNFLLNNQMAIIYPNSEEEKMISYCSSLESDDVEVLCYSNTINQPLAYNALNAKFNDLGQDTNVEDYLLRIIYYHYFNADEKNEMTLQDLVSFIKQDVYANDKMNANIDNNMKKDIDRLEMFANKNLVTKVRSKKEIANTLNISEDEVNNLLIYYNSKKTNTKLTLNTFVNFMNKNIVNSDYGKDIDSSTKNNLAMMTNFTNQNLINKEMTATKLSTLFRMQESDVNNLLTYYISLQDVNTKMSLYEFSHFVNDQILTNETYKALFDVNETSIQNIKMLMTFSNQEIINRPMTSIELSNLLGRDITDVFYMLGNPETMTPYTFVNTVINSGGLDEETSRLKLIMDSAINNQTYSYEELSHLVEMDSSIIKSIYNMYFYHDLTLTPLSFVNFIIEHQNDSLLQGAIDKTTLESLLLVQKVMQSTLNNTTYSSASLAQFLNMDEDTLKLIYSLYDVTVSKKNINLSFKDFVSFLTSDVMHNKDYSKNFNKDTQKKLTIVNQIINDTMKETKYNKDEVYNLLSPLANDLDHDLIDLVYIYYGSVNAYHDDWTLTIETFVNFINDDILKDHRFDDYIDADMKEDATKAKDTIKDAKELLVGRTYSRAILNTNFQPESEETFNFIQKVKDEVGDNAYVIGDSLVAYEMRQTFQNELNLITILTMLFIFVVVAYTFKSLLIPIILVLLIQSAVYLTMGILSFGGSVYYMSILIVQSILMGATIDYAILYTSYYLEGRTTLGIKDAIILAYNDSIHTILTSASILAIVTLIVGHFSSAVAAKICTTISEGTICSAILIVVLLPAVLAACDKFIVKKNKQSKQI